MAAAAAALAIADVLLLREIERCSETRSTSATLTPPLAPIGVGSSPSSSGASHAEPSARAGGSAAGPPRDDEAMAEGSETAATESPTH